MTKEFNIRGRVYQRDDWPLICAPLVASNREQLVCDAETAVAAEPDLLEWRIDFFQQLENVDALTETIRALRQVIGETPLLVTRRSVHEGGESIDLDEAAVIERYGALLATGEVDLLDYEISQPNSCWQQVRALSQAAAVPLIGSYHNFSETPVMAVLLERFQQAEQLGADIAKVAVMPQQPADVLRVLEATESANEQLQIPLISMSMAAMGVSSRLIGGQFGSCLTFATVGAASAPGQVPIGEVKTVLEVLKRYGQ